MTREDVLYELGKRMTREKLIETLSDIRSEYNCFDSKERYRYHALSEAIEITQERKTGKWIVDDEYIDCSYCKCEKWSRVPYEQLVSGFRFCPHCGAMMEVEDE